MHSLRMLSLLTLLAVFTVALAVVPAHAQSPSPSKARRPVTLDDIYAPDAPDWDRGDLPEIVGWMPDGKHYVQRTPDGLTLVATTTGAKRPLYDSKHMEIALASIPSVGGHGPAVRLARQANFAMDREMTAALIEGDEDIFLYDFKSGEAQPLTQTPGVQEQNATFSPDKTKVAFFRKGNLYVMDPKAPGSEKRLTHDGTDLILNGRLDWVYEEEVYGRGRTTGYWWSPDGKYIAFLRLDDKEVVNFPIVDHLPRQQNVENWRYPLAGDPNPKVSLGIVPVDGSASPKFVDLSKYPEADRLVVRVAWQPDSKQVWFQMQNRIGNYLDLNVADVTTAKTKTLFRETTPAWVEIIDNPRFLKDGSFLWLSERTGYRHIYRYKPDGNLLATITKGEWDVRGIRAVNEDEGFIAFISSQDSPIQDNAYRVNLDGTDLKRLTAAPGQHDVSFALNGAFFVDTRSTWNTPPTMHLCNGSTGEDVRLIADNAALKSRLAEFQEAKVEFLQVKTRDGFVMEAEITKPANFDPNKKYPVYMSVYAGPGAQTVRGGFGGGVGMFDQILADKGIIVWRCDNRSASGKGAKSAWACYKKMGVSELADIEDSLTYLKSLPYIDGSRIAISGWSFGGFMTAYALTHSKSFKIGIAGAGVMDWRLYDTIYTERYMDTPQNNPEGYKITSCIEGAKDCAGKLLLLHGMMDDNVHLQNTIQLTYALQKAGKEFEMMIYPSPRSRHGIGDRDQSRHLRDTELRFIEKNL